MSFLRFRVIAFLCLSFCHTESLDSRLRIVDSLVHLYLLANLLYRAAQDVELRDWHVPNSFQRVIRERMADQADPLLSEKKALAADFKNAVVREISLAEAKNVVVTQEWLGNLGSSEFAFGLYFGEYLAGVVCFGSTAGTKVKASVCGTEHADKVTTLTRGCCLHFAHPHSGSFLVSAACREMTKKGYHIVIAYADLEAGERGVIFRPCNFLYCGTTSPTEKFRRPDGKVYDARNVHLLTRDRRFGRLRYKRSRAEQKQILIAQGCEFFKDSGSSIASSESSGITG